MNYTCKICGDFCKNSRSFTNHLRKHKVSNENYYRQFILKTNEDKCLVCNKTTNFKSIEHGYFNFCSVSCSRKHKQTQEKVEQTNLKNHGTKTWNNREKSKITCKEKHDCEYVFQSDSVKNKIKYTVKQQYGYDHISQVPSIRNKIEQTCLNHFGNTNPLVNEKIKEKIKQTNIKLYGTSNPNHNHFYRFDNKNFDSSYELAYYIWLKKHNIDFEYQPDISFSYEYNGTRNYYPDFLVEDNYVELKGSHFFENHNKNNKMINPYDRSQDDLYESKHQCMLKYNVEIITDCDKYIEYVSNKYGKDYIKAFIIKTKKDNDES